MRDIDPVAPGEIILEDFLKPLGITQYRLAKSIKVPASRVHDVVHGKRPITAELALRLARFFGTDAQSWVNLQAHYDLGRAEIELAARVKKEVKPHGRWRQGAGDMGTATGGVGGTAIAMRGAGYYSTHTIGAKTVIDKVGDRVVEAVRRMPRLEPERPFVIADFGAADGGTSMDMMCRLVDAIREREPEREINIVYTDLPHNDFSTLFRSTQGLLGADARVPPRQIPLGQIPNLYIFGSGTSFYRQIVSSGTLSLGFSATAMHWLSRRPCMIAGHVQAVGAAPAEREQFRVQALADWETILLARARELRPGGRLLLANFCIDEAGRYLGHTGGVDMFDSFARHWRDLHAAGRIGEAEYVNATLQQFYKTHDEFAAPFRDPASAVSQAGLRLEHISTMVTPCPFAEAFRGHRDAAAFAKAYVPTLRSWTETTFAGALDPARPAAERVAIVDAFYGAYEAEVARAPEGHGMDYVHCVMEISKAG